MRLESMLKAITVQKVRGALPGGEVKGLTYDSRLANEGIVFAALPGAVADGHNFVAQAARAGALACLVQRAVQRGYLSDRGGRLPPGPGSFGRHEFYGRPSREMTCVGITGNQWQDHGELSFGIHPYPKGACGRDRHR